MRLPLPTRARAWLLRTFRGRSRDAAGWAEAGAAGAGPPESFAVGELRVHVTPKGLRPAGEGRQSLVYEVHVGRESDPRSWSSRYGFPPREGSARRAADAALDELDEVARDPDAWRARLTEGMTEDEVEAIEDSPATRLDLKAAEWVGPVLAGIRPARLARGSWLEA